MGGPRRVGLMGIARRRRFRRHLQTNMGRNKRRHYLDRMRNRVCVSHYRLGRKLCQLPPRARPALAQVKSLLGLSLLDPQFRGRLFLRRLHIFRQLFRTTGLDGRHCRCHVFRSLRIALADARLRGCRPGTGQCLRWCFKDQLEAYVTGSVNRSRRCSFGRYHSAFGIVWFQLDTFVDWTGVSVSPPAGLGKNRQSRRLRGFQPRCNAASSRIRIVLFHAGFPMGRRTYGESQPGVHSNAPKVRHFAKRLEVHRRLAQEISIQMAA